MSPDGGRDIDDLVVVEPKIDIGKIEHWPLQIDLVYPRRAGDEALPVVLCLHQGGRSEQIAATAMKRLVSQGKLAGLGVPCINPIDPAHPTASPEFAMVMSWLHENAEVYDITPTRVGIWVQTPTGHTLHTLERGSNNLLSSMTVPFESETRTRFDGGTFEVEEFFNRQLRGEETSARRGGPGTGRPPGRVGQRVGTGGMGRM